jgi:hypothetical protein
VTANGPVVQQKTIESKPVSPTKPAKSEPGESPSQAALRKATTGLTPSACPVGPPGPSFPNTPAQLRHHTSPQQPCYCAASSTVRPVQLTTSVRGGRRRGLFWRIGIMFQIGNR